MRPSLGAKLKSTKAQAVSRRSNKLEAVAGSDDLKWRLWPSRQQKKFRGTRLMFALRRLIAE